MKHLSIGVLSSVLTIMLALSCSTDSGKTTRELYRYHNETSEDIDITRYWTGEERLFTIASGSFLELDALVGPSGDATDVLYLADSIKVTFNNSRSLLHRSSDIRDINILLLENYTRSNEGDDVLYEYSFTSIDLDAAD